MQARGPSERRQDMKVKVGNKIYDSNNEPVMVILSKGEKEQISNMHPDTTKYCVYPNIDKWTKDDYKAIKQWMSGFKIIGEEGNNEREGQE